MERLSRVNASYLDLAAARLACFRWDTVALAPTLAQVRLAQGKVLNRLLDAGRGGFEGGINTRKYMSMTKTSRVTAYRGLAELVAKGCLAPTGKGGRSSGYEIVG